VHGIADKRGRDKDVARKIPEAVAQRFGVRQFLPAELEGMA
jgi:hypothetical protein